MTVGTHGQAGPDSGRVISLFDLDEARGRPAASRSGPGSGGPPLVSKDCKTRVTGLGLALGAEADGASSEGVGLRPRWDEGGVPGPEEVLPDDPRIAYDHQRARGWRRRRWMQELEVPLVGENRRTRRSQRASCGRPLGPRVTLERSSGRYTYKNLVSCKSVWACGVCSPKERYARGLLVEAALTRFHEMFPGGCVMMVTATVRHSAEMSLQLTLGAVMDAWRAIWSGKGGKEDRDRFGIKGQVRAVEVQAAGPAGWHPHVHALLFFDRALSEADRKELERSIFQRWSNRVVARHGLVAPTAECGVVVRPERRHDGFYVTKGESSRGNPGLASEITRHDLKPGEGSMGPFELLDAYAAAKKGGDTVMQDRWAAMWGEYVAATAGRQCMHWSPGLQEMLWPEVSDGEDRSVRDDPEALSDGTVFSFDWHEWAALSVACGGAGPARLLDLLEQRCWEAAERFVACAVAAFEQRGPRVGRPLYIRDRGGGHWRLWRLSNGWVEAVPASPPGSAGNRDASRPVVPGDARVWPFMGGLGHERSEWFAEVFAYGLPEEALKLLLGDRGVERAA
jgi:hypothetical protein